VPRVSPGAAEKGRWGPAERRGAHPDGRRPRRPRPGGEARSTYTGTSATDDGVRAAPGASRPPALLTFSRRRAAVPPLSGAMFAADALEVVRPDQLSWTAPDRIHTVAPRGDEHTNQSCARAGTEAVPMYRAASAPPAYVRRRGSPVGSVGREQSHHLRCRIALRDACARVVAYRRCASLRRCHSDGVLRCPGTAGQCHYGAARRSRRCRSARDSRAARVG
jgi:hypothetical protein